MKQKAKRILVVMLTVMIIFGYLAPLVADEANAATADLDLCDLGCELEHCDGDHCDGGHYDEENCDWGHCDEEICDGVICDGDNCDGDCYSEHYGDCECENGHCDEQCDVISSEEVSSSSSVGRRAKAEAVCNHTWKTMVSKQPGCTTAGVYVTRCTKCGAYAQNGNGYITPLGHKWTKRIVKQPTCTQQGEYETRCQRCNAISANGGGYLPALGHALSWRQVVAPTETSTGVEENKCNRCGYVAERRSLPPLGNGSTSSSVGRTVLVHPACAYNKHVWRTYTTKEPTCTTSGTYITKCSVCGAGSPNGNGYLPALGHKWNRTAPTCTQDKKCDRCGTVDKSRLGHSYAWRTKVNATCTANGTKEKYCTRSGCGYVAERQTIQALGHAWDNGTVTKEATCTATGVKTKKCTRSGCSATTTEEIPKAAHNCEWRVTVQASCKGAGTRQLTCKVCGTGTAWESIQYYGDHTWVAATCTKPKTCSVCGTTSGSKLDHAYAWRTTVNPTCTTVGKKEQYCTRPGCTSVVNRQDVAALNHAWDYGTVTKAATHSATGVKTFKCTRSGCSATKTESIPVIAHSYTWVVTTPSTCTKEGVESYKCSCGYVSQTRPVAKKAHNGVWATTVQPSCAGAGTEECKCSVCGTWLGSRGIQYYGDHTWNRAAADCTNDKVCTVCGYIGQKAPGHVYTGEATCTADKKCSECGYIAEKALTHDYQVVVTKAPTCERGTYIYKCTRCNTCAQNGNGYLEPTEDHYWKYYETKDSTCTEEGRHVFKCDKCGAERYEVIAKAKHKWIESMVSGHCEQEGTIKYSCQRCGTYEYRTEIIQHKYWVRDDGEYVDVACMRCGKLCEDTLELNEFLPLLYSEEVNEWKTASGATRESATKLWFRYYYSIDKASADELMRSCMSIKNQETDKLIEYTYVKLDDWRKFASALYSVKKNTIGNDPLADAADLKKIGNTFTVLAFCRAAYDAYDRGSLDPIFAQGFRTLLGKVAPTIAGIRPLINLIKMFGSKMDKYFNDGIECYYEALEKVYTNLDKSFIEAKFGSKDLGNVSPDEFNSKLDDIWDLLVNTQFTEANKNVAIREFMYYLLTYGGYSDPDAITRYVRQMGKK